ncbi:MAG: PAS domain S-box protein [Gammaproteobacteria bacterium]
MKAALEGEDFRLMLDSISDGLFVMDHDWNLVYLNRRAEEVLGIESARLLGRNVWQVFPEAVDSIFYTRYHQAVREHRLIEFEAHFAPLKAWFAIRAYPQRFGLLVLFVDITQRREEQGRLEAQERHYRMLFTRHPAPMWIYDIQTLRVLDVNEAAVIRYGYPREHFLQLSLLDLRPPEDREKLLNFHPASGNLVRSGPWNHMDAQGRIFQVEISRQVIDLNGQPAHLVMAQDISERLRAEEQAQQALERFRAVARVNSDAIWDWDLVHHSIWWSEGFHSQFGYSPDEVQPTLEFWSQLVHPEDVERVNQSLQEAITQRQMVWEERYRFRCRDGHYALIEDRGTLMLDSNGEPIRMVGGMRDVTLQNAAQQDRRDRERFFRLSLEMLAIADAAGTVRQVSPAFTRILGYELADLGQSHFMSYVHPEDVAQSQAAINQLQGGADHVVFVNRCRSKAGEYRWIEWSIGLSDHLLYAAGRDISARVAAEQSLKRTLEQLSQRNAELQEFAFVASHDLKEPLRKILAFSERLAAQAQGRLDENGQFFLQRLTKAAQRMDALLDALLSYSRLSGQQGERRPVDLRQLISEVCSDLEMQIDLAGARVRLLADLPTVEADAQQLRQVFQNLISNALKFRSPQRALEISIEGRVCTLPQQGEVAEIEVRDNGIGFDPRYAEQIFTPFQRLHSQQEFEGSGIGLAIVRKIIEQHGGQVSASGQPDHGTCFLLRLPLHSPTGQRQFASQPGLLGVRESSDA